MTKIIIMPSIGLENFYRYTLQYLHDKYHSYPSSLLGIPVSKSEAAEISYNDAMARHTARGAQVPSDIPIGKRVA